MFICEPRPAAFIHVHIPRTGGTSLGRALERVGFQRRSWRKYTIGEAGAMSIRHWIGAEEFDRAFVFSFVRNPWERLVSRWACLRSAFARHPPNRPIRTGYIYPTAGLPFLDWLLGTGRNAIGPLDRRPQKQYVSNMCTGEMLVDFVGRFEHYARDVAELSRYLGVDLSVHHGNKSDHGPYRGYYNPEGRDFVAELCAADIEEWGYEF